MNTETHKGFEFALAKRDDVPELVDLVARFYRESDYATYADIDLSSAAKYGETVVESGLVPHIVARKDTVPVGLISYSLDTAGWVKPIAVMQFFYVLPEHRKSFLGRALLALAVDLARGDGACAFHAPVASGTRATGTLKNLFTKHDFEPCGFIMRKVLQ